MYQLNNDGCFLKCCFVKYFIKIFKSMPQEPEKQAEQTAIQKKRGPGRPKKNTKALNY